ncbi:hypothetical protein PWT90_09650 [Aphanocladium album]|nr:hypothetical protein PWT90_09650 [Aphanocladium album]
MDALSPDEKPPLFNYVLSFLLVGIAWGGTTPFIRIAAKSHKPPQHKILDDPAVKASWLRSKLYGAFFGVVDLLRSVWFFLLIGQAVPIVNTMAFLCTVLGEWLVEGKVISRGKTLKLITVEHRQHPSAAIPSTRLKSRSIRFRLPGTMDRC